MTMQSLFLEREWFTLEDGGEIRRQAEPDGTSLGNHTRALACRLRVFRLWYDLKHLESPLLSVVSLAQAPEVGCGSVSVICPQSFATVVNE